MARLDEVLAGTATWGRWALDQAGHVGLGTAYALPAEATILFLTSWGIPGALLAGSLTALAGGTAREIVDGIQTGKAHPLDRAVDALFHLPGAAIALALVMAFRAAL